MRRAKLFSTFVVVGLVVSAWPVTMAQDPEDATRKLWDTAFIESSKSKSKTRRKPSRRYRVVTPRVSMADVSSDTVVGVTVWRLRRSNVNDVGERIITHEGEDEVEWLPERISSTTKLLTGDRLRISVEAARSGYLYVIDREQYADGTYGEPYLIFPTKRTLNGDNSVRVGKLIEIPAQDDEPPYFKVRRTRPDHVAEVLSVLITPQPIADLEISDKALKLTDERVAGWEKQWGTLTGAIELEGGVGKSWTKEEKLAASGGSAVLDAKAPAPQVVYYRPQAKASEPIMVKVQLHYGARQRLKAHQ